MQLQLPDIGHPVELWLQVVRLLLFGDKQGYPPGIGGGTASRQNTHGILIVGKNLRQHGIPLLTGILVCLCIVAGRYRIIEQASLFLFGTGSSFGTLRVIPVMYFRRIGIEQPQKGDLLTGGLQSLGNLIGNTAPPVNTPADNKGLVAVGRE